MLDQVRNPEDRFSHNETQKKVLISIQSGISHPYQPISNLRGIMFSWSTWADSIAKMRHVSSGPCPENILCLHEPQHEKSAFCIRENKGADQLGSNNTVDHDQCLCFSYIVQFTYLLNLKFQASSHLLWLFSLVCVERCQIPKRHVFFGMRLIWAISLIFSWYGSRLRATCHRNLW